MKAVKRVSLFIFLALSGSVAFAQTLPLGLLSNIEDNFRRQQLLGNDTSKRSFMVRPLHMSETDDLNYGDSASALKLRTPLWASANNKFKLYALPIAWQQQFNSHHPYGINDGAMIPSKGYQTMFSAGVFFKAGPLTVQFRPEYVFAQDSKYPVLTDYDQPPLLVDRYYNIYHKLVDAPTNYSVNSYSNFNLGQSSIRLNLAGLSLGISNENLWWGPGNYNSLLMSNSSPGFRHLTLNTTKPLFTVVGSFEGQLVSGMLENSGIDEPMGSKYIPKNTDNRYFNGLTISYQPKWIPGLYLGFSRSFTAYSDDVKVFGDYLPVFSFLTKAAYAENSNSNTEDSKNRNQLISLFMRWVWPESKSEIYFEWGREDHSWNLRDAFLEPEHSRAYIVGFTKLLPLAKKKDEFIRVGVEFSQLETSNSSHVRSSSAWYTHGITRHGYTNKGQFIGAGNGPDNMQTLDVAWVRGLKRLGVKIERQVHNNDLYFKVFEVTKDSRKRWVDLGIVGQFDFSYRRFTLNTQMGVIRSLNYQYYLPNPPAGEYWYGDKNDVNNFNVKIGIMYSL